MKHVIRAFVISFLLCCGASAQDELQNVSIIQLIASPEKYEGKAVRVQGFFRMEHESTAIHLSKEDSDQGLTKNGLWVNVSETAENQALNNKYVLIEGTFNSKNTGHRGLWSGSIEDIKRIQLHGAELVENLKNTLEKTTTAQKPWTVYEMKLVQIKDEPGSPWVYVIGYSAFRTAQALKDSLAPLSEGNTIRWDSASELPISEDPLGSPQAAEDFKNFCKERKINLEVVPHP